MAATFTATQPLASAGAAEPVSLRGAGLQAPGHSRQLLEFGVLLLLFVLQLLVVGLKFLQLELELLVQAVEGTRYGDNKRM